MAGVKLPEALRDLAVAQCGLVTRSQCQRHGVTSGRQRHLVASERWQRLHRGVYATFTGGVGDEPRVIGVLLAVGGDAAASHETALWLADRRGSLGPLVHVAVSEPRRVATPSGALIHHVRHLRVVGDPSRVVVEEALLDAAATKETAAEVTDLVCRMIGGRRTTPARLSAALVRRRGHRWRRLLQALLADVERGAQSPLELADLMNDQAHGLPTGKRQVAHRAGGAGRWLDLVVHGAAGVGTVVKELDGRLGHEGTGRFRDMRRDNASTVSGGRTLRFGWADEIDEPCETAAMQAFLWRRLGAAGTGTSCHRPGCELEVRVSRLDDQHPQLAETS